MLQNWKTHNKTHVYSLCDQNRVTGRRCISVTVTFWKCLSSKATKNAFRPSSCVACNRECVQILMLNSVLWQEFCSCFGRPVIVNQSTQKSWAWPLKNWRMVLHCKVFGRLYHISRDAFLPYNNLTQYEWKSAQGVVQLYWGVVQLYWWVLVQLYWGYVVQLYWGVVPLYK